MESKQRTILQNKSLHKYCELLSIALCEAGITQKRFIEAMDEIENSPESVKSVFRAMGKAKYNKISTADLTTKEMNSIYEEFTRNTAKIGIYVKWPSAEPEYGDNY
jgi:hypothetical protein